MRDRDVIIAALVVWYLATRKTDIGPAKASAEASRKASPSGVDPNSIDAR